MSTSKDAASRARHMANDWSAAQYLKFEKQRTRPSRDLLAQVPLRNPRHVLDIGCGPGNSTQVLVDTFPQAKVEGMDSSPDMLAKARKTLPDVSFYQADLVKFEPGATVDLIFSNAVFQWIRSEDRIAVIRKLIEALPPGGVFAMQAPNNRDEPSHAAMRAVAEDGPWADMFRQLRPGLEAFQAPQQLYDALIPLCSEINIWQTAYEHPLDGHEGIIEWVKGTGLRPFLDPLDPENRESFLAKYLERLKEHYPLCSDGKVLLRFPRLFIVAVRA